MKRNIIVTIEFLKGHIRMCGFELLNNNNIEIYNKESPIEEWSSFLPKCIKEIESNIGGKLSEVTVIIQANKKVGANISLTKESIAIASNQVSSQDIKNLIEITKEKFTELNTVVSLIQPLQYEVSDIVRKSYSVAPISKKGDQLSILMSVTTVNKNIIDFVTTVIKAQGIKVSQILLKPQAISHNNLSDNALTQGATMIHVGYEQSHITINKNKGTVNLMSFYEFGMKNLLSNISKEFNCSIKKAFTLLSIYGEVNSNEDLVIYTNSKGINQKIYTSKQLGEIISIFINRLISVSSKYIEQKNVKELPIVISGDLNSIRNIEEYFKLKFSNLSLYKPMSYCEMSAKNRSTIGVINFNKRMSNVLGKNINTIVETNPSIMPSLNLSKKKSIIKMITNKIGGKYDWNN